MPRSSFIALLLFFSVFANGPFILSQDEEAARGAGQKAPSVSPQIQKKFDAFDGEDKKNPPEKGGVLLVGSSSLEIWGKKTAARDLAPFKVMSRAIGGTRTDFQVVHFDRLTGRYQPDIIVYYSGDNDIGKDPEAKPEPVAENFGKYSEMVKERLPGTKIVYITIKPSVQRWAAWPAMDKANKLVKEICDKEPGRLFFLDIGSTTLDSGGRPDPAMFAKDGLHVNEQCYAKWGALLKPVLEEIGKAKGAQSM